MLLLEGSGVSESVSFRVDAPEEAAMGAGWDYIDQEQARVANHLYAPCGLRERDNAR
ncbi:MAG TPA: hypothetical protein VGB70_06590 [Allosphingosinicella sp.]|jgi:hypothetical protein